MARNTPFHGIYPMVLALFDLQGNLEAAALSAQVELFVRHGAQGVAVMGLATEINKLSTKERQQCVEVVATALNGRLPLSVTVGENTARGQTDFARAALAAGADWLILQPPPVSCVPELELQRFFGQVADQVDAPLGIQNAPGYLGIGLSPQGLKALQRQHANVRVLKIEDGPLAIPPLIEETAGLLDVFVGRGGLGTPDLLRAGAVGIIPGAECVDRFARAYALLQQGKELEARAAYREVEGVVGFLEGPINHYVTYSREILARRMGLPLPPQHRLPAEITPFGLDIAERAAQALGPL